jgi:hypothetical protein
MQIAYIDIEQLQYNFLAYTHSTLLLLHFAYE